MATVVENKMQRVTDSLNGLYRSLTDVYAQKNAQFKIRANAFGSGLSYQWQISTNGGTTWNNSTAVSANTDTLITTATTVRNGYQWRCVTTYNGGKQITSPVRLNVIDEGKSYDRGAVSVLAADYAGESVITAETAARTAADAILTAQAQSLTRSLDFLWKLNKGISYTFETDETAAYSKTVPTGAKVCDVRSVGGKSIVWNQMVDTVRFTGFSANTISGGVRRLTAENNSNRVYFDNTTINASDVFYMCADVYGVDGATVAFVPYNFGGHYQTKFSKNCTSHTLTRISLCCSFTNTKTQFQFTINGTYPIGLSYVDGSFRCVNLTKMFGAGNEPTTTDDPRIAMIEAYAAEHPEYNEGEIISADVTAIDIVRADDSTTITIPAAVRALEGYGWSAGTVFNEVDFANKKFIKRVDKVDLGECTWGHNGTNADGSTQFITRSVEDRAVSTNGICDIFSIGNTVDGYINLRINSYAFTANTSGYTSPTVFRTAMSGHYLFYELATPVETDISALLTDSTEDIEVESGGSITMVQDGTQLAVPSNVEYLIALNEVTE